jgi:hypothetical protein
LPDATGRNQADICEFYSRPNFTTRKTDFKASQSNLNRSYAKLNIFQIIVTGLPFLALPIQKKNHQTTVELD